MKKAVVTLILVLGLVFFAKAQSNINDYKYVIVPNKFDFLKMDDQYQLNSLTKFLFNKYGFNAIMINEEYPADLASNPCLSLKANVENLRGFLKTKLRVVLLNCKNKIIYTSEIGETKEKDYKKAYVSALRSAFKSFETNKYSYKPNKNIIAKSKKTNKSSTQEIEKLKEEIKTLKEKKSPSAIVVTGIEEKAPKVDEILEVEVQESQPIKVSNVLYAQEIENGFQVVNSTPKIVMILLTTPKLNTFIVKGRDAIVYKEDGFWFISENKEKLTTTEKLEIKF